jgi:hypothetical protein
MWRNKNWSNHIPICRRSAVKVKDVQSFGLQFARVRIALASHATVFKHSAYIYARAPSMGCHGVNHVALREPAQRGCPPSPPITARLISQVADVNAKMKWFPTGVR